MISNKVTYSPMEDTAGTEFSDAFVGWTVVSVGMTKEYSRLDHQGTEYSGSVEGGLTFILHKNGMLRKVILGYTELGEWLEHVEDIE